MELNCKFDKCFANDKFSFCWSSTAAAGVWFIGGWLPSLILLLLKPAETAHEAKLLFFDFGGDGTEAAEATGEGT